MKNRKESGEITIALIIVVFGVLTLMGVVKKDHEIKKEQISQETVHQDFMQQETPETYSK